MTAEVTGMLEAVGISAVEERIYLALFTRPGLTARALSEELALRGAEVRRALERLESEGLLSRSTESPHTYLPAEPDLALEVLTLRRREEMERIRLFARQLASRLRASRDTGAISELVQIVEGPSATWSWLNQLQQTAQVEVLVTDRPPYVRGPAVSNDQEFLALERGIKYRAVYHQPAIDAPGHLDMIERYMAAGEESRVLADVPVKVLIVDRKIALMPLRMDEPWLATVLIRESALLDALIVCFESLWARALPLQGEPNVGDGTAVSIGPSVDRRLLSLLASGLIDEVIARQLGVSSRTIVRRVERLMNELGASTRFQLGVQAARQQLL